ncbi:hypothetical protein ACMD2_20298 [Ananas comosus]|uniref:Uncharacterized protein n=1 Tax=Ananas comosus TaxID=4615 RepID=A0A199UY18_ANACO|nr:hypothetical protein ACMD2_20298 [Ananas comosus]
MSPATWLCSRRRRRRGRGRRRRRFLCSARTCVTFEHLFLLLVVSDASSARNIHPQLHCPSGSTS